MSRLPMVSPLWFWDCTQARDSRKFWKFPIDSLFYIQKMFYITLVNLLPIYVLVWIPWTWEVQWYSPYLQGDLKKERDTLINLNVWRILCWQKFDCLNEQKQQKALNIHSWVITRQPVSRLFWHPHKNQINNYMM